MARLVEKVTQSGGSDCIMSRLFHTPAFPPGSGPQFVNAAVRIEWRGSAGELLAQLHEIEEEFGRTRAHRWEARVMDLDLIGLGDAILPDAATRANWANLPPERAAQVVPDQLILPHPRLEERGFVLVPLADVAPEWVDPATGLSVAQMLAARPKAELAEIRPVPVAAE
ncbi:MAG: 2-amino-4-hydroxy-6-hydroxymethyldihydropteridine diphosphokinase [Gymnodinialimonas sp.]